MPCIPIKSGNISGILCTGEPVNRVTDATGKEWLFTLHRYCGPVIVGKRGDPLTVQPGSRSRFWDAFDEWKRKGDA